MPFKDTGNGQTHYLDENGKLVGEMTPEELEKWQAWQDEMMNESAESIRKRLGINT
jgi:hypothetical protein